MENNMTLAQYISTLREAAGWSQIGLATRANIPLKIIEQIESGEELFLATPVRQKLAKALKIELIDIKVFEREPIVMKSYSIDYVDELKLRIKQGILKGNICPLCQAELICNIVEMFDLEDRMVKHPKAKCSVCTFQIR